MSVKRCCQMGEVIMLLIFGLGMLLLIGYSMYKALRNKKDPGNMYTPYDDMTRGTNDANSDKSLEEDTRHTIPIEETQEVEEEVKS